MKKMLATINILRSLLLVAVVGMAVSASETTEINTRSATIVPIKAGQLLVIYEMGNLDRNFAPTAKEVPKDGQVRMAAALGRAVEKRFPAGFESKGIPTRFVILADDKEQVPPAPTVAAGSGTAASNAASYVLRIRAFRDTLSCREPGICMHRLMVRASILRTGSGAVLWSTEFEEPAVSPLAIDELRFETLAQRMFYTLAQALRPAS